MTGKALSDSERRHAAIAALAEIREEVWAIRPSAMHSLYAMLSAAAAGDLDADELVLHAGPGARSGAAGVGIIPIRGSISRRSTLWSDLFGGTSTENVSASLKAALADPNVARIVLEIDSPGGTTDGIPELADEIFAARSKKPITAMIDTLGASAAYWIASQANDIVVTPSAKVGSIGVFSLHLDQSKMLADLGVTPTFIQAGKYKTEENPLMPLSDEGKATIQKRVDSYYSMFVKDVARGRGVSVDVVRKDFGEGRVVLASEAITKGMADRIGTGIPAGSASLARADADVLGPSDVARQRQLEIEFGALRTQIA